MKVLFISEYYPPHSQGGGERSAKKLIESIKKQGAEVDVLTSDVLFLNVKDWRRHLYFPLYTLYETFKRHRKNKYDVIHCLNSTSIYAILLKPI